ncbi:zf-HC2 domain-containing protein [Granulicoccus sp. GXG6511]|uniref:zf-HC2 domain-containing protein n=1 Tax=Granulicoccus sp. GXG6511 TaxID=3381351 RepID=UPI003D7D0546
MRIVHCPDRELWRSALSARLDGEERAIGDAELDAHLRRCAECAEWYAGLGRVTDHLLGADLVGPDLSLKLIGATEAHICGCHVGEACECTDCQCTDCTCGRTG